MSVSAPAARPVHTPWNALRGFLIGLAELVPGISGGTVALVTGVYERALAAASDLGGAFAALVKGPDRAQRFRTRIARVDWWLVAPVLAGMACAVLFAAGAVEALVSDHPENARGLFFGLVAASLIVPLRLLPRREGGAARILGEAAAFVGPAILSFVLVGFANGGTVDDPNLLFVFGAAIIAVCALVVPGVSGSFFLLAIGLYAPTLQAVDQHDLAYIGVFAAGALVGLFSVVRGVRHLLAHHRRLTLIVMAGLMLGSMRALWPWQSQEDAYGTLLAPADPLVPTLLAIAGALAVIVLIAVEHTMTARRATEDRS